MSIEPPDLSIIEALKRENVELTLAGLGRFMANASWVGTQNRYARSPIKIIGDELRVGDIQSPSQLSQLIAASCLLHCSDGWSYLGRAIGALLRGDPHRARHLAYYAELRAAISLLATEGIGVFNYDHFAITGPNSVTSLYTKKGTHIFAWDCLEYWSEQPSSANLFVQIIKPYGISLDDWCAPLGGGLSLAPHARNWFRQWGMDLRIFPQDHVVRNMSTYEPDGLPAVWALDAHSAINFVSRLWEALEPSPVCRFDSVDQHILRISLERYFFAREGRRASSARPKFKKFIASVVEHQGLSEEVANRFIDFMTRQIAPKDMQLLTFSQKLPNDMSFSAYAVMSRATLLLRTASGSTSRLFQEANHSVGSFKFWWEQFGATRGLWDRNKNEADLLDLWADVEAALGDLGSFQNGHPAAEQTYYKLAENVSSAVMTLGTCERVAMWSMAS